MVVRINIPTLKKVKTDEFGSFHGLFEGDNGQSVIMLEGEDDLDDLDLVEIVNHEDGVSYFASMTDLIEANDCPSYPGEILAFEQMKELFCTDASPMGIR